MKSNPKGAHDASAKLLHNLADDIEEWRVKVIKTLHFTQLLNERIDAVLFPGTPMAEGYCVSHFDRTMLGFLSGEAEGEASEARVAADEICEKLQSLVGSMNEVSTCAN